LRSLRWALLGGHWFILLQLIRFCLLRRRVMPNTMEATPRGPNHPINVTVESGRPDTQADRRHAEVDKRCLTVL